MNHNNKKKMSTAVVMNPHLDNIVIDFANIRGLNTNLNSVHQHLQNQRPHLLVLTETQIKPSTATSHLLCPGYELHDGLRYKGGVCAYTRNDVSCRRERNLETSSFDIIWLKVSASNVTKFVACVYRSPNDNSYQNFFDYLSDKVDHLVQTYPSSEVILLGDFNVHNSNWLKYSKGPDAGGRAAENFAISRNLTQLIDVPTRIPDIPLIQPTL